MEEVIVKGYRVPRNLLYTETDEWIRIEGDIAVVGVTDYAQKKLKNVIGVELPQKGSRVRKGDSVGVIESIKAVADLYTPVSGEIVEVNERLREEPELVNHEPYGNGWIFKVRISNREEVKDLLTYEKYAEKISRE
ncbi:MAG: glycine cleavage system protein GcvH [Desulfurococcales archaeon]|jgi:glycine cleavage system H protein|nr:glycine cleavage system protein GcvH [Desulfurococcales archaeon]